MGSRSDSPRQYRSCSIEIPEISRVHTNLPSSAQQRAHNIPTKDSDYLSGSLLYGCGPTKNLDISSQELPLTPQPTFLPAFHFLISKETVIWERRCDYGREKKGSCKYTGTGRRGRDSDTNKFVFLLSCSYTADLQRSEAVTLSLSSHLPAAACHLASLLLDALVFTNICQHPTRGVVCLLSMLYLGAVWGHAIPLHMLSLSQFAFGHAETIVTLPPNL